jgi:hypothetical protein
MNDNQYKAKLLIATPIRGANLLASSVSYGYAEYRALLCQITPCELLGPALAFSCDNIRGRNRIATVVLRDFPSVERVLWWDDDQWPSDIRIVQHMIDTGEDMIGGAYTNKIPPVRWIHQLLPGVTELDQRKLLEVMRVGFGFTMTSRRCLERMAAKAKKYVDYLPNGEIEVFDLFGQIMGPIPGKGMTKLSEDFSFCDRWRAMNGRIWVWGGDSNVVQHAGGHVWDGTQIPGTAVR